MASLQYSLYYSFNFSECLKLEEENIHTFAGMITNISGYMRNWKYYLPLGGNWTEWGRETFHYKPFGTFLFLDHINVLLKQNKIKIVMRFDHASSQMSPVTQMSHTCAFTYKTLPPSSLLIFPTPSNLSCSTQTCFSSAQPGKERALLLWQSPYSPGNRLPYNNNKIFHYFLQKILIFISGPKVRYLTFHMGEDVSKNWPFSL